MFPQAILCTFGCYRLHFRMLLLAPSETYPDTFGNIYTFGYFLYTFGNNPHPVSKSTEEVSFRIKDVV
ncbi:MAG: hypothetical protein BACD_00107 [Bacteroides rodentium]